MASLINKFNRTNALMDSSQIGQFLGGSQGISGLAGAASEALSNAMSRGRSSGAGNFFTGIGGLASKLPGTAGLIGSGIQTFGGAVNNVLGSKLNAEKIAEITGEINKANSFVSSAGDYDALSAEFLNMPTIGNFSKSDIGSDGVLGNKADKMYKKLKRKAKTAEDWVDRSLLANANNIASNTLNNMEQNWFAQGGDFTTVDAGGTHEQNPFNGVPMGIGNNGKPNLVEEGETIYNDYVYSNRMAIPKELKEKYKIKGSTYADAAKEVQKESKERPYDNISKRGLDAAMTELRQSQEAQRELEAIETIGNMYAGGGKKDNVTTLPLDFGERWENPFAVASLTEPSFPTEIDRSVELDRMTRGLPSLDFRRNTTTDAPTYNESNLRYAPAIMSAASAIGDLFSKPNYSAAKRVEAVDTTPAKIKHTPIGGKRQYTPIDTGLYINPAVKTTAAARRAAKNSVGGNRAAALAAITGLDNNFVENLGKLAVQAEEYNNNNKAKIADFNRAIDIQNASNSMAAQSTNASLRQSANQLRLAQIEQAAKLRQLASDAYDARRSNNLNQFINNLGNIGWEEYNRAMINSNPALFYALSNLGNIGYKRT